MWMDKAETAGTEMGGEKDKNERKKTPNTQCWGESNYLVWVLADGHWGISTSIYK